MAQDISTTTSGVVLPKDVSEQIIAETLQDSAIMQLATQTAIPSTGVTFQTITGEPTADWVSETELKPVGTHTFGSKSVTPYKMAVIEPFSAEFVRDKTALYKECVKRLPFALSKKFDQTVLGTTAPGTGFDVLGDCTKVAIDKDAYEAFVTIDGNIADADGMMNGIALGAKGRSLLLAQTDKQGRPLFTPGVESGQLGNILGAGVSVQKPIYVAGKPATVGIAGDFANAFYGISDAITISKSDQASLKLSDGTVLYLFQQNMVAVRVEFTVGFYVRDKAQYNLLTDGAAA